MVLIIKRLTKYGAELYKIYTAYGDVCEEYVKVFMEKVFEYRKANKDE